MERRVYSLGRSNVLDYIRTIVLDPLWRTEIGRHDELYNYFHSDREPSPGAIPSIFPGTFILTQESPVPR